MGWVTQFGHYAASAGRYVADIPGRMVGGTVGPVLSSAGALVGDVGNAGATVLQGAGSGIKTATTNLALPLTIAGVGLLALLLIRAPSNGQSQSSPNGAATSKEA